MKTSISIPEPIFEAAERLAGRLHLSRSELYAKAVSAYVREYSDEEITAKLNEVYEDEDSGLDPVIEKIQFASLPTDDWE